VLSLWCLLKLEEDAMVAQECYGCIALDLLSASEGVCTSENLNQNNFMWFYMVLKEFIVVAMLIVIYSKQTL